MEKDPDSFKNGKNHKGHISKKGSFKYSKTEKNETPTKLQGSIKTIKVTDSRWKDVLKNGMNSGSDISKGKAAKKKSLME